MTRCRWPVAGRAFAISLHLRPAARFTRNGHGTAAHGPGHERRRRHRTLTDPERHPPVAAARTAGRRRATGGRRAAGYAAAWTRRGACAAGSTGKDRPLLPMGGGE